MKKVIALGSLVSVMMTSQLSFAGNYCAGIRGNGELALSHWASLARIIENKGMPEKVAGGSSAAITLFMLDAISRNQSLSADSTKEHAQQALMLKSLVPHILYLYQVDAKSPVIMRLIGTATGLGDGGFIHKLKSAVRIAKDLPTFFDILGEYGPLLNPEIAKGLRRDFSFYKAQLSESLSVFGSFDAKNDKNIFFRKGLVDFKYLALLLGRVADMYAGHGSDKTNEHLSSFLNTCSMEPVGKTWDKLIAAKPECSNLLVETLNSYYEDPLVEKRVRRANGKGTYKKMVRVKRVFPNKMVFEKIGSGLNAFPTTAVVMGDAVDRYNSSLADYETNGAVDTKDFTLDFNTELKYGYWGRTDDLKNIQDQLQNSYNDDTKSSKFHAINGGVWFEALATSPAEPGLSNLVRIPDGENLNKNNIIYKPYFEKFWKIFPSLTAREWFNEKYPSRGVVPFREGLISAGGWSDLHPTLVLRANDCEDVIYITRQGGESVFGQQIFIRLTDYTDKIRFWGDIRDGNRDGWTNLTVDEESSPWNKLYNLANPDSSFNKSISEADAVYCTNWDKFNVFKGDITNTMTDAYNAPVFLKDESRRAEFNFGLDSAGKSPDNFPGCIVKNL